jgi:dihydrolipoamide dehydrogenase
MPDTHYGAVVIGAGPGGYPCAIRLGQLGVRTLIVEKDQWGGVCLNVGCIPSKALITAAKKYEEIQHAAAFGFQVAGPVTVDVSTLQKWKGDVVGKLTGGVRTLLKANKVDMLVGTARLAGERTVEVTTAEGVQRFTADAVILATGSSPIAIPGFSFADAPWVLDSTGALALTSLPQRLVVIGGGYIGLEMSGVWAKLGTKVTVVEMMDQLLPGFDPDVVKVVERRQKKDGVRALLRTRAIGWERVGDGIEVEVESPKGREKLACDHVLVTVGRRPNTRDLGLEALGVAMDGAFVGVDRQMRTNLPWLYAIGDVAGNPMLAHKATHDGEVAAEVVAGHKRTWDARTVPAVVFTDPEVATAGLTEPECAAKGLDVLVGKVPFAAIGRAIANNETDGFVKVIVDKGSKLVLGVTVVGYHASDIISEAALAIEMCAEALDVGLTIHPHPTLGESIMEAAKAALGEAIHVVNRA